MTTALERGLVVCHVCLALNPLHDHRCRRCHSSLHARTPHSIQRTVALLITACILYLPANLLPIMTTTSVGSDLDSTIIGGVLVLWRTGSYPVALVILTASVMVPVGKILALSVLCWLAHGHRPMTPAQSARLYRITDFIGKWSMVDVFVVAILVALIQIGDIMAVRPGAAALAFAGVVITTMFAAESFDPLLIWNREIARND